MAQRGGWILMGPEGMIDLNTGHFGSSMPCGCPQSIGQLYLVCVHGSIHNLLRFSRYTRYRHITTWPVTVTAKARPEVGPHARPNDGSATGWCDYWFATSIPPSDRARAEDLGTFTLPRRRSVSRSPSPSGSQLHCTSGTPDTLTTRDPRSWSDME